MNTDLARAFRTHRRLVAIASGRQLALERLVDRCGATRADCVPTGGGEWRYTVWADTGPVGARR